VYLDLDVVSSRSASRVRCRRSHNALVAGAALVVVFLGLALTLASSARADWNADHKPDVLALNSGGSLLMYRGNGVGGWITGTGEPIGHGWGSITAIVVPDDFTGDGKPDVIARTNGGALLLYRGNGTGGWLTGTGENIGNGWSQSSLLAAGDFNSDFRSDLVARMADGTLRLYRGNGAGGWINSSGEIIGQGWESITAIVLPGDFSGDGNPDLIARTATGALLLYRGNGSGGWITGTGENIGNNWAQSALLSGGDFSGDGRPDLVARLPDGTLRLYRGNGAGGWINSGGEAIGHGWGGTTAIAVTDAIDDFDPRSMTAGSQAQTGPEVPPTSADIADWPQDVQAQAAAGEWRCRRFMHYQPYSSGRHWAEINFCFNRYRREVRRGGVNNTWWEWTGDGNTLGDARIIDRQYERYIDPADGAQVKGQLATLEICVDLLFINAFCEQFNDRFRIRGYYNGAYRWRVNEVTGVFGNPPG
jgi:hypothetical protein